MASIATSENSQLIDHALAQLQSNQEKWRKLSLSAKASLLSKVRDRLLDHTFEAGRVCTRINGFDEKNPLSAINSVVSGILPGMHIVKTLQVFSEMERTGSCPVMPVRTLDDGQQVLKAWPNGWTEEKNVLLEGIDVDLYVQPGKPATQGAALREQKGGLRVVLGAGNQGFLSVVDTLHFLFARGEVVVLKPHPRMAEFQRVMDKVFAPLSDIGVFTTLYLTEVENVRALLHHPQVTGVHMTGGIKTHDAIVFGADPEEQRRRKEQKDPLLKVPMSSELGCVTPQLIAPAQFGEEELLVLAQATAASAFANNGCNCNMIKVLLLPGDWSQREHFMALLRKTMQEMPTDPPTYPGVRNNYQNFLEHYPQAERIVSPADGDEQRVWGAPLPWLLNVIDPPANPKDEPAFREECFGPVLTVVTLPTTGVEEYLSTAVEYANENLWGSLTCCVYIHPSLEVDCAAAVSSALQALRYGTVSVNNYSGVTYMCPTTVWGAWNGGTDVYDAGSGVGFMLNWGFVDHPQKAVVRMPWNYRSTIKPRQAAAPLPDAVVRVFAGYIMGGFLGIARALLWVK